MKNVALLILFCIFFNTFYGQKYNSIESLEGVDIVKVKDLDLSNQQINNLPEKLEKYKHLTNLNLCNTNVYANDIIRLNFMLNRCTIKYSFDSNEFNLTPLPNTVRNKIQNNYTESAIQSIILGNYYKESKHPFLNNCMYENTLIAKDIENYETRMKIANELLKQGADSIAYLHYEMVINEKKITNPVSLYEIAKYFENNKLDNFAVKAYSRLGFSEQFKNSKESLFALLVLANYLDSRPYLLPDVNTMNIYERICFSKPSDNESIEIRNTGCQKCYDLINPLIIEQDKLNKEYKEKKINRLKASQTAQKTGSVLKTVGVMGASFIPGVGGYASQAAGYAAEFAGSVTALALLYSASNFDYDIYKSDNEIARLCLLQKRIAELTKMSTVDKEKFMYFLKELGWEEMPKYIEIPADFISVTDPRDNNKYEAVKIGSTWWFTEDLNYNSDNSKRKIEVIGETKITYRLYKNTDNVCPNGWSLPDETDWDNLVSFFGGKEYAYNQLIYGGLSSMKLIVSYDKPSYYYMDNIRSVSLSPYKNTNRFIQYGGKQKNYKVRCVKKE